MFLGLGEHEKTVGCLSPWLVGVVGRQGLWPGYFLFPSTLLCPPPLPSLCSLLTSVLAPPGFLLITPQPYPSDKNSSDDPLTDTEAPGLLPILPCTPFWEIWGHYLNL